MAPVGRSAGLGRDGLMGMCAHGLLRAGAQCAPQAECLAEGRPRRCLRGSRRRGPAWEGPSDPRGIDEGGTVRLCAAPGPLGPACRHGARPAPLVSDPSTVPGVVRPVQDCVILPTCTNGRPGPCPGFAAGRGSGSGRGVPGHCVEDPLPNTVPGEVGSRGGSPRCRQRSRGRQCGWPPEMLLVFPQVTAEPIFHAHVEARTLSVAAVVASRRGVLRDSGGACLGGMRAGTGVRARARARCTVRGPTGVRAGSSLRCVHGQRRTH